MYSRPFNFQTLRRGAAVICAAAYLAGGMELLPQMLALDAWMEGCHEVSISRNGEQLTIVLGHERTLPGQPGLIPRHQPDSALHRHGAATRVLCVFAAQRSRYADHVASFVTGSVSENVRSAIEARARSAEFATVDLMSIVSSETACSPAPSFPNEPFSQPRPPDSLRLLRSIVLVV